MKIKLGRTGNKEKKKRTDDPKEKNDEMLGWNAPQVVLRSKFVTALKNMIDGDNKFIFPRPTEPPTKDLV